MATATKVQVNRADALALVTACGWKTAEKWSNADFERKLRQVKDVALDPPSKDEKIAATQVTVLSAIEDGADFEVVGDDPTGGESASGKKAAAKPELTAEEKAAAEAKKAEEKAAKEKEKEAAKEAKAKEKEAAKEAKKAEKEKEKAEKKAARDAAKAEKKQKKEVKGRGHYAGVCLKEVGFTPGMPITDAMIARVDTLYGKPNPTVSKGALGWAISALEGYMAGA